MFLRTLREEAARLNLECPEGPALAGMETHFRLLRKWNRHVNLTGLRDEREIARRHFLESLQASFVLPSSGRLLDLGSGNGFPGVPVKLLNPAISLITVDSSGKKCAFLKELFRALGWDVKGVVQRRIDKPGDLAGLGTFRSITMRAVPPAPRLLRLLLETLDPGGTLLLFLAGPRIAEVRTSLPGGATLHPTPLAGAGDSFLAVVRRSQEGSVPRETGA